MTDRAVMFDAAANELRFAINAELSELRGAGYEAIGDRVATTIEDWWPDLTEDEQRMLCRVFRFSADYIRPTHIVIMLYLCVYDDELRLRTNAQGHFIASTSFGTRCSGSDLSAAQIP
jgi:hypothetical protein